MAVRYATEFGLVGDGSTDDTTALQAAIDALEYGDTLLLVPGAFYSVTNIVFPHHAGYTTVIPATNVVGPASIIARSGGSSVYLACDENWRDNVSGAATSPWRFDNIQFDANDLKDHAFVSAGYSFFFYECSFNNGLQTCMKFTRLLADGVTSTTSFLSGSRWDRCLFRAGTSTATALFLVEESSTGGPADGYITSCEFNARSITPYALDMAGLGGWTITGCQTYASTARDFRARFGGRVSAIANNTFEEGGRFDQVGSRAVTSIGPGNRWRSDVDVYFDPDGTNAAESIIFVGDHFEENLAGNENARLCHKNTTDQNKVIVAVGCSFYGDAPFSEDGPATGSGLFHVSCFAPEATTEKSGILASNVPMLANAYTGATEAARFTSTGSTRVNIDRVTPSSGANIGVINFRDSATEFVYGSLVVESDDATSSSEDGQFIVQTAKAGSPSTALVVDGSFVDVQAGRALRVLGGTLNVTNDGSTSLGGFVSDQASSVLVLGRTSPGNGQAMAGLGFTNGAGIAYARILPISVDVTGGSEDGALRFETVIAGSLTVVGSISDGMTLGVAPTGGAKGNGSLNTSAGVYRENVPGMFTTGTKTTAAAPYTNDGYITVTLADGTTVKVMTTA